MQQGRVRNAMITAQWLVFLSNEAAGWVKG